MMSDERKKRRSVGKRLLSCMLAFCLFISSFAGIVFFTIPADVVKADDKVKIKITGGAVLDEGSENVMNDGEWALEIQSSDVSWANPNDYEVSWGIQTGDGTIINMSTPSGTAADQKFRRNIQALAPGKASIYVMVYNTKEGETYVGQASCDIRVAFGIDTSNDTDFKYVYEDDADRSLIMYAHSTPQTKQLKLNFGSAALTTWRSTKEEVITVNSSGVVSAIGAGYSQIEAEYTPSGSTQTYTAYLGVYVIPMASSTNGSGYSKGPEIAVDAGGFIYTDTVFSENIDVVRSKIYWSIKVEATGGTQEEIANSAGRTSGLISLNPTNSHSNEMQVDGISGTYYIWFYVYNRDHALEIETANYTATVVKLTIKSAIKDKDVVLGIGDTIDLADSYNMSADDFKNTFTVMPLVTKNGSPAGNYATLDSSGTVVRGDREETVLARMQIKAGKEKYVRSLLGIGEDDTSVIIDGKSYSVVDGAYFTTTISIVDGITLGDESIVIGVKQTYQLIASLHGTYQGTINWVSSDSSFVTVDDSGLVTGVKVTTSDVVVTASVQIAGGITRTASCMVKVEPALTKFTLIPVWDGVMNVGDIKTLEADIKETVSVAPLRWISSKEEVFTCKPNDDNKTCVINAVAGGTATLMVENMISGERVTLDITVRIPIDKLEFKSSDYKFPFYQSGHLMMEELELSPADATSTKLIWTSDNTSVATVDNAGYLKFVAPGTVSLMARPEFNPNQLYAVCIVKIIGGPDNIVFSNLKDDHLDLEVSETKTVELKFEPTTAETELLWKTNLAGLVTVDYDKDKRQLKVLGRKVGNVTVTCRTDDNVYYSFTVTVKQASQKIEFTVDSITLYRGDVNKGSADLSKLVKMTPAESTDTITYSVKNEKIAKVDAKTGVVTGESEGTTYVTATTSSGRANTIDIIVIDRVTEIQQDFRTATVYIGKTLTIEPTVLPETASNKTLKWYQEPYEVGGSGSVTLEEKGSAVDVTGETAGMVMLTGVSVDNESVSVSYILTVKYKNPQYKTVVKLSPATKYVNVGKTFRVTRKITGAYKGNKTLKWKSSKKKVATVNSKGKVTAKKVGKTTITAIAQDGSKAKGKMKLIVRRLVTDIKMNKSSANILVGKSVRLSVKITPANATVKGVKWTSGDTAIATVDGGKVIGVAPGLVKITATSKDANKKKAYCWVTVSEPVPISGFTIENANLTVAKGDSVQSGMVPNPTNATDSIRYWSDNPSVATVSSRGKIKTHRVGEATIYARASNGVEGHVDVTVVDLNRKAVTLRQYDTEQLSVVMIDTGVTWYSADPNIARVDANGLVTARMPGTTIIYATVNGVKLGCRVTVTKIT